MGLRTGKNPRSLVERNGALIFAAFSSRFPKPEMRNALFLACLFLTGCSMTAYMEAQPGDNQRIVVEDGHNVLYSQKANLAAAALPATFETGCRIRA